MEKILEQWYNSQNEITKMLLRTAVTKKITLIKGDTHRHSSFVESLPNKIILTTPI
jgi:hypothetical protein